jgi:hypothetical protein
VCLAQDALDRGLIARRRLEREQPRGYALEVTLGLLDEQWTKVVF